MSSDTHAIANSICPVCGMKIAEGSPEVSVKPTVSERTETFFVCCDECADDVRQSPELYLDAAQRNVAAEVL
jgi:hypothetical protein